MDPENTRIVTDAIVEISKILGPALIAAFAAYKSGMWQVQAKLKELESGHTYSAAEKLFDYYRDREKELSTSHENITKNLGFLIGYSSGATEDDESVQDIKKLFDLYVRVLPNEIKLALRDLKKYGLEKSEEYSILEEYLPAISSLESLSWADRVFKVLEIYGYLQVCNRLVLEQVATNYLRIFART